LWVANRRQCTPHFGTKQHGRKGKCQRGTGLEDLLLDPRVLPRGGGQKLEQQLGGLGLACARLARDDATLVPAVAPHVVIRVVGDGKHVRWHLTDLHPFVRLDRLTLRVQLRLK
jgi:hypothetical protein